jgi:GTPase SAR1 family protein
MADALCILVAGPPKVGKTSLTTRLIMDEFFEDIDGTVDETSYQVEHLRARTRPAGSRSTAGSRDSLTPALSCRRAVARDRGRHERHD